MPSLARSTIETGRRRVLGVQEWAEIRAMGTVQGVSIKEIARRTGHSRNTVRAALRSPEPPRYGPRPKRPSKLDPFLPAICELLDDEPTLSGVRIREEIEMLERLAPGARPAPPLARQDDHRSRPQGAAARAPELLGDRDRARARAAGRARARLGGRGVQRAPGSPQPPRPGAPPHRRGHGRADPPPRPTPHRSPDRGDPPPSRAGSPAPACRSPSRESGMCATRPASRPHRRPTPTARSSRSPRPPPGSRSSPSRATPTGCAAKTSAPDRPPRRPKSADRSAAASLPRPSERLSAPRLGPNTRNRD
jgi:hypothetical protein